MRAHHDGRGESPLGKIAPGIDFIGVVENGILALIGTAPKQSPANFSSEPLKTYSGDLSANEDGSVLDLFA